MIRRPPRSTLFPTRRSSDLTVQHKMEKEASEMDRVCVCMCHVCMYVSCVYVCVTCVCPLPLPPPSVHHMCHGQPPPTPHSSCPFSRLTHHWKVKCAIFQRKPSLSSRKYSPSSPTGTATLLGCGEGVSESERKRERDKNSQRDRVRERERECHCWAVGEQDESDCEYAT